MAFNINSATAQRSTSVLATNTILRNTYLLLSLTLLFSAATAYLALLSNAPPMHPLMMLAGYFGLLFLTQALRNSGWGLVSVFALTGFMGYTLGPMLNFYLHQFSNGNELIMMALGSTGLIFLGLSGYALSTRKDFSYMGAFLMIGAIVTLLASLASIFLHIPGLTLAVAVMSTAVSSGLILWQTGQIINSGETNYIMATIMLYVSLYNIFANLLYLLGAFSGNRD